MNQKAEDILTKLEAFPFGRLQDAASIITFLERHNISPAEFVEAVRAKKEKKERQIQETEVRREKAQKQWQQKAPRCPDCGMKLSIRPIRAKQQKQNRFGWRSHWYCMRCAWEQYSVEPVETEIKNYMEE